MNTSENPLAYATELRFGLMGNRTSKEINGLLSETSETLHEMREYNRMEQWSLIDLPSANAISQQKRVEICGLLGDAVMTGPGSPPLVAGLHTR
jgi:hypothetical protein